MQSHPQAGSAVSTAEPGRAAPSGGGGFAEWWWVRAPAALRRFSVMLADTWLDGAYLTAWPVVSVLAPLCALLVGVAEGATHWTWLPGDLILDGRAVTFTELLPFVVIVAAASALSANLGLMLTLGFALGDFLIAGAPFEGFVYMPYGTPFADSPLTPVVYIRIPQLLSYALLLLLALAPTLCTKYFIASLRRILQGSDRSAIILRAVVAVFLQGVLVYAWKQAAPLIIRVFWGWTNSPPPLAAAYYLQERGGWVVAAAALAAATRAWLIMRSYREAAVRQRLLRLLSGLHKADRRPAFTRRLPLWLRTALMAAFSTLLASGFIGSLLEAAAIFLFVWLLLVAHQALLPRVAAWAAWTRLVVRVPLLLRAIAGVLISFYLGRTLLGALQEQQPLVSTPSGTFQPLLISLAVVVIIWMVLVPHQRRSAQQLFAGAAPAAVAATKRDATARSGQPGAPAGQ